MTVTELFQPTAGSVILDSVRGFVSRFCQMPTDSALDLTVLWIAHSHCVDQDDRLAFDTSPRLMFSSDQPASGKSRALEMVALIAHSGQIVCDPTAPSFAQLTGEVRATVLVDELDCLIGKGGGKQDLRGLFNSSYKRSTGFWSRAGKPRQPVFAAVAFAGLGSTFRSAPVLSALRSRTLVIEMVPSTPPEKYKPRIHDRLADMLRAELAEWAGRNTARILDSFPDMPEGISDRAEELAEPLLMVADQAGGHWPETARNAVRELMLRDSDAPAAMPLVERLVQDIRTVFTAVFGEDAGTARIGTVDLLEELQTLPDSPWADLWRNPVGATKEMAALLAPLGVEPMKLRIGERLIRGYRGEDLAELWADHDHVPGVPGTSADGDVEHSAA